MYYYFIYHVNKINSLNALLQSAKDGYIDILAVSYNCLVLEDKIIKTMVNGNKIKLKLMQKSPVHYFYTQKIVSKAKK